MSNINELIIKKLEHYPSDVMKVANEALKLSERGLPESAIAEHLENVLRQIVKNKGAQNDT